MKPKTAAERRLEDGALFARARAGDAGAWNDLVAGLTPLLWRVARSYRLDEAAAADVVQNTWLALAEHAASVRDPNAVRYWLAATARRACLRELRHTGRIEPRERFEETSGPVAAVEDDVVLIDRDRRLRRAFDRLAERDRMLLTLLVTCPDMSYAEVAAALEMPVGSIGPTRRRCLERLRGQLAAEGIHDRTALAG